MKVDFCFANLKNYSFQAKVLVPLASMVKWEKNFIFKKFLI